MKISSKVKLVFDSELNEIYKKLEIIQSYLEDDAGDESTIYGVVCLAMEDIEEINKRPNYNVSLTVTMEGQE